MRLSAGDDACDFFRPFRARFVFLGDDLPMTSSWAGMSRPVGTRSAESESLKV
jgi:hypothetical protein